MKFSDILSLFKQGKGTAKSHMKNLIEMAAADGNFDEVEYSLLKDIAKRNHISESQLKDIRKNPSNVQFELPDGKKERFHQFYDLVHMMSVDEQIHADELKLSHLFVSKFGYKRDRAKELVDSVRINIQNGQNYDETLKRVEWLITE